MTAPVAEAPTRSGGAGAIATRYRVSRSARIKAPPGLVYEVIADYKRHHPNIVPPPYFRRLEVLEGGVGAGTRTRVEMRVLGITRVFEQVVSEPQPGRVLVEENQDGSAVTTFTVQRTSGGGATRVTITTVLVARGGLLGLLERLATSLVLPRIYGKELERLDEYVAWID